MPRPARPAAIAAATAAPAPPRNVLLLIFIFPSVPISAAARFRLHQRAGRRELTSGGDSEASSWEALLAAAQLGDGAAYRRFLEAVLPFARAVARRRLAAEELVEDAVQDSLLTLHRVRHTYQPGRPVKPWLTAVVDRRAIDVGRRRARIARSEVADPGAYETFADPAANREAEPEALARMMAALTGKEREAVELVKLREMSLAEASAESGQSVGALKVNVHRAIRRLRRALAGGEAP